MFKVSDPATNEAANRFPFQIGKDQFWLPLIQFAPLATMVHFENGRDHSALVAAAPDEATREALSRLGRDQAKGLSDAWVEASDMTPGESEASPAS